MNEYEKIVSEILNNNEFKKLKGIKHHNLDRLEHSKKVSYYSFIVTKKLNLDYVSSARAGLLHDFFLNENNSIKERTISFFIHPSIALKNSKINFNINKKEENIISSHMFPMSFSIPRYKESLVVSIVDKIVAIKDFSRYFKISLIYKPLYTLILIVLYLE